MEEISRRVLADAGKRAGISGDAMDAALRITGLHPTQAEWRAFAVRGLQFAGVLSLAAGMIFLVAFNWQDLGVYPRFVMVQIPILAALIIAWIKGTDGLSGKLALMLAVLLTGALLALFGQTYQTGADVYELFLGWAVLALPWVIACRYAPCWALWLLLVNAAVALFTGVAGHSGFFRLLFLERWRFSPWCLPFLLDLLIYITLVSLSRWKESGLAEEWLRRAVMAVAMAFGTFAMVFRIAADRGASDGAAVGLEILLFLAATAAFAVHAYSQKQDLFNFAVLALAWIVVTTTLIGRAMLEDHAGVGTLFVIAIYVIIASTAAVKGIAYLGRQWKTQEAAQ